jgi:hypothetical protein
MTVWMVPQALGNSEFWTGIPSKREFLAMALLGVLHGVTGELQLKPFPLLRGTSSLSHFPGILPWTLPTSPEILDGATQLVSLVPHFTSFILNPLAISSNITLNASAIEARLWTLKNSAFLLVANTRNQSVMAKADFEALLEGGKWREALNEGIEVVEEHEDGLVLALEPFGTGGWVRQSAETREVWEKLLLQG